MESQPEPKSRVKVSLMKKGNLKDGKCLVLYDYEDLTIKDMFVMAKNKLKIKANS